MTLTPKLLPAVLLAVMAAAPAAGQLTVAAVIQAGIKKVIRAMDLRIQRQQITALGMQQAQKAQENTMVETQLAEISHWIDQQRRLYQQYYQELWQVKSALRSAGTVRHILKQEGQLVSAYQHYWKRLRPSAQFSIEERDYLADLYGGILRDNRRHMAALAAVIQDFRIRMPDGARLEIIRRIARRVATDLDDLQRLNRENEELARQRFQQKNSLRVLGTLYGVPSFNPPPAQSSQP